MCVCVKCSCANKKSVSDAAQAALNEASKRYCVRHVRTGRFLFGDVERTERPRSNGQVTFSWVVDTPRLGGDWLREEALAIAKMWIAVSGDMEVEIQEVKL